MKTKTKIMTHLVAGYPTYNGSLKLAQHLAAAGADILEIQIPFSEPVADGPTIVETCHTALKNGFETEKIFEFCKKINKYNTPIYVMTYANPLLSIGIAEFCKRLETAKVSGLIVPDIPFDSQEGEELRLFTRKHNIDLIQVISPSIDRKRLHEILRISSNTVYCTTKSGTTGAAHVKTSKSLRVLISEIRKKSDLSIAVGFGISTKQDVHNVGKFADIVVLGSSIIRKFNEKTAEDKYKRVSEFLKSLRS